MPLHNLKIAVRIPRKLPTCHTTMIRKVVLNCNLNGCLKNILVTLTICAFWHPWGFWDQNPHRCRGPTGFTCFHTILSGYSVKMIKMATSHSNIYSNVGDLFLKKLALSKAVILYTLPGNKTH